MTISDLPFVNACLNSIAFLLLILGFIAIKKKNEELHKKLMVSALIVSAIFLSCYLVYHYHAGSKAFPNLGWVRTLYLTILIPHIILAAGMVPLIIMTFYHAFKDHREKHKKWAVITFPIWLYVSVTGVIIYYMLYVYAPSITG